MTYGGDNVPKSPFSVPVAPSLDLSKIKVTGLGNSESSWWGWWDTGGLVPGGPFALTLPVSQI